MQQQDIVLVTLIPEITIDRSARCFEWPSTLNLNCPKLLYRCGLYRKTFKDVFRAAEKERRSDLPSEQ